MASIGTIARELLTPLFKKHCHLQLMMDWPSIVGQSIAHYTWPQKIVTQGVLYLRVSLAYEIQAWGVSPLIIERVNQYLGYQAVKRIRFMKTSLSLK